MNTRRIVCFKPMLVSFFMLVDNFVDISVDQRISSMLEAAEITGHNMDITILFTVCVIFVSHFIKLINYSIPLNPLPSNSKACSGVVKYE